MRNHNKSLVLARAATAAGIRWPMLGLLLLLALFLESASFIDGFLRFVLLAFSLIRHFLESGLLVGKSCIPGSVGVGRVRLLGPARVDRGRLLVLAGGG